MTPQQLVSELAKGQIRPAYLLAGEEALLRDEAIEAIRAHVLVGGADDFNFQRLPSEAHAPVVVADALAALPVLATHRLVLLVEPETRRAGAQALLDALAEALPRHLEQRESVFVVAAARPDNRTRWVRAFRNAPAATVECKAPQTIRGLASFIRAEAGRQGVAFAQGAPERLAELVGPQLLALRQEIAKISLFAGPGVEVTTAHVEQATQQLAEESIWALADAIGFGNSAEALFLLSRMDDIAPPALLGALAAHFRNLSRVRSGAVPRAPRDRREKLASQARRFSPGRLRAGMQAIHETDVALKGRGELSPELALERLVLALSS